MSSNILPKAAAAVAILGVAGSVSAQTTFDVTATVQNALTVTNVQDLNLGTIFATAASDSAYKYVELAPSGTYGTVQGTGATTLTLLTLGGQQAARGSVAVGGTTPVKVTLPAAVFTSLEATGTVAGAVAQVLVEQGTAANPVEVRLGDPLAARFYLGNFRAGAASGGSTSGNCSSSNVCTITPAFGQTSISFGIGATLVTDVAGGTRVTYEDATYTGSFEVTAAY